jgi:hypothetical protein
MYYLPSISETGPYSKNKTTKPGELTWDNKYEILQQMKG